MVTPSRCDVLYNPTSGIGTGHGLQVQLSEDCGESTLIITGSATIFILYCMISMRLQTFDLPPFISASGFENIDDQGEDLFGDGWVARGGGVKCLYATASDQFVEREFVRRPGLDPQPICFALLCTSFAE